MKANFFTLFFLLFSSTCFTQNLAGLWQGNFIDNKTKYPIALLFRLKADSTYDVRSYSRGYTLTGEDTVVICNVVYNILSNNSVHLEEVSILSPAAPISNCLQKMRLRFRQRKKFTEMAGYWVSTGGDSCAAEGEIYLRKEN